MTITRLSSPRRRWLSTVLLLGSIDVAIVAGSFFSVPLEKMVVAEAGKLKERQ